MSSNPECSPSICFVISRSFYHGNLLHPSSESPIIAPDTLDSDRAKRSKASCRLIASSHHGVAEQRSLHRKARRHVGKARLTSRPSCSSGRTPRAYCCYQEALSYITGKLALLPCRKDTLIRTRQRNELFLNKQGPSFPFLSSSCVQTVLFTELRLRPRCALHLLKGSGFTVSAAGQLSCKLQAWPRLC